MAPRRRAKSTLTSIKRWLSDEGAYFTRPVRVLGSVSVDHLRSDVVAGLTIAVVLLPQAIAYAMIAELPPQMGLYTAIVGAIVGALWGSSRHLHSGPTNAISLLVLASLLTVVEPGSPEFLLAAGLLAVLVGVIQIVMGMARMGALVNFISDSVVVGFTAGAAVLIGVNQLRHLLRLDLPSLPHFYETAREVAGHLDGTHLASAVLGFGSLAVVLVLKRWRPAWPGALLAMVLAAVCTAVFGLADRGVIVLGELPRNLPPITKPPLLDLDLIGKLSAGALAIAAIGLVEAMSIARSVASRTGQILDSNQEFVGQGLANVANGFLSGYAVSGSFTRTAVNHSAGGRHQIASVFSGLWVLAALLVFAPLAVYLPRAAVAGVLLATAYGMVDRQEIMRIMRSSRGDTAIFMATFLGALVLPLEFAVLAGVFVSFARYLVRTSTPEVQEVVPDDTFRHLIPMRNRRVGCPQLGIVELGGSLYFGAVNHVEMELARMRERRPGLIFILLRMRRVNTCDVSGIHMLEALLRRMRARGGDVFLEGVRPRVLQLMSVSGFLRTLGHHNVLRKDDTIGHLFHTVLHPGICIYECEHRVFAECQALPKHAESADAESLAEISHHEVAWLRPSEVRERQELRNEQLMLVDVGETREFEKWHVPGSHNVPLPVIAGGSADLPRDATLVLISRIGRRSTMASHILRDSGYENVFVLQGGTMAWEAAGYPLAVE